MGLKQPEYFVRVAELGSFTRAAIALDVAQPVLSRQVRLLRGRRIDDGASNGVDRCWLQLAFGQGVELELPTFVPQPGIGVRDPAHF